MSRNDEIRTASALRLQSGALRRTSSRDRFYGMTAAADRVRDWSDALDEMARLVESAPFVSESATDPEALQRVMREIRDPAERAHRLRREDSIRRHRA